MEKTWRQKSCDTRIAGDRCQIWHICHAELANAITILMMLTVIIIAMIIIMIITMTIQIIRTRIFKMVIYISVIVNSSLISYNA